jgi:hypothetical protein
MLKVIQYPSSSASNYSRRKQVTPRNGIPFHGQPTTGRDSGDPVNVYPDGAYAAMLDSLFEQARDMAEGNGVPYADAVDATARTLTREDAWRFLPSHLYVVVCALIKAAG